jgi:hypothetical protein
MLPQLMFPNGLRLALTLRRPACALDAYVQLAEEAYANVGYVQGLWAYRNLVPEPATRAAATKKSPDGVLVEPSAWP